MSNPISILYVDDEPLNLTLFALNFKSKYNIITANDGFEGIKKLSQYPEISVVISDMKMPGMNGVEFIELIKRDFPNIPCFILTGFDATPVILKSIENGMVIKCFSKPFNISEISNAIEDCSQ
jgi:response regulator RpfG family c-di-GMP phosphodiesterase